MVFREKWTHLRGSARLENNYANIEGADGAEFSFKEETSFVGGFADPIIFDF